MSTMITIRPWRGLYTLTCVIVAFMACGKLAGFLVILAVADLEWRR